MQEIGTPKIAATISQPIDTAHSMGLTFICKQWPALLILTIFIGTLPLWLKNDYFFLLLNIMALNALVVMGLNLLIGSTGQVSLGHAAFYGMGAYISAFCSTTLGWPLAVSFLAAVVAVGVVATLLALPTLRLEGHYLVMATLGFNIIVNIVLSQWEGVTGGPSGFPGIPKLHLGPFAVKTDLHFYFFIWSVFLVAFALTLNLLDSRIGRALHAIHEKDLTAQALGVPCTRYKVTTFALSAIYAAVAGFCYAHYVTFISPKTFDIFYSVQVVTMLVVGGMGSLWGGLAGTVILTLLPEFLHRFEDAHVLLYGLILMGVLVFCPQGLIPALLSFGPFKLYRKRISTFEETKPIEGTTHSTDPGTLPKIPECAPANAGQPAIPLLELRNISLSFGGVQALQEACASVFPGEVVALIGPNGAGKTTLLNVASGLIRPSGGEVLLRGKSVTGLPPHRIAACGVGRTFQAVQVYSKLTVLENMLVGCHTRGRTGFLMAYLHSPAERREEAALRTQAMHLLGEAGLADKAHLPAEQLSLIDQKLLEFARALALSPNILLLDEPAGGLNPRETELLVGAVALLRKRGMGVMLVEHDMNVVMRLADRIVVLNYGQVIATGTPREIQRNDRVRVAYLGTQHNKLGRGIA